MAVQVSRRPTPSGWRISSCVCDPSPCFVMPLLVFVVKNAGFDNVTELFGRAASFVDPWAVGPRSIATQTIVVIGADLASFVHLDLRDIMMGCSASTEVVI